MDDFDNDNLVFGDDEAASERLLHFSKDCTFLKINNIHTLKEIKILNIIFEIEKTFLLITELDLPSFCLTLWEQLLEIKNDLKKEMLHSAELCIAFDELLYLAKYLTKGGDRRGLIQ